MRQMDWILREVIEIELYPNVNKEDGFSQSWAWKPLNCDLKEQREADTKN
jgi:hypothetical protein